ncbi:hypothetical protein EDF31_101538 [Curtobacterium sp. PhB142]|nr:hypothetical protein EDF31_101538 [Curtobacterium sp. PhB142]TCM03946.1 hypothetical protein EDF26_102156 [Curtobacterium sp. PhB134]
MENMLKKLIGRVNRIADCTNMSNVGRNGGAYENAVVVLAYACLVHELAPVVLAVLRAAGLA